MNFFLLSPSRIQAISRSFEMLKGVGTNNMKRTTNLVGSMKTISFSRDASLDSKNPTLAAFGSTSHRLIDSFICSSRYLSTTHKNEKSPCLEGHRGEGRTGDLVSTIPVSKAHSSTPGAVGPKKAALQFSQHRSSLTNDTHITHTRGFSTNPFTLSAWTSLKGLLGGTETPPPPRELPYIQYPIITKAQMNKVAIDKYKFDFAYASFSFHSTRSESAIHSLSDLTDPAQLNSLLPRRRPHGSPADTLSIKSGDDAMLVSPSVLAVADGVSGWESKGEHCSSGVWSRSMLETLSRLLTEYKISHFPHYLKKRDIDQIIDDSYLHTSHLMDLQDLKGSSTLILGMLAGDSLKMISIGDSKLYVIRDGKIIKTNEEQLISELCPQQIGTQTLTKLPSDLAWVDSVTLKEGDIILVCSDGISDNLYEWELQDFLNEAINVKHLSLRESANKLLARAKEVAFDDYALTPYNDLVNSLPVEKYGKKSSSGGKLDDMSICLARVELNSVDSISSKSLKGEGFRKKNKN